METASLSSTVHPFAKNARLRLSTLVAALPLLCAAGCATPGAPSSTELEGLRAELRAVRDANARLERRLDRIEAQNAVLGARAGRPVAQGGAATQEGAAREIPELAVVKLKPRKDPAPPLPTATPIVEPPQEVLDALASSRDGVDTAERDGAKEGETAADAAFEEAVNALRTGNVSGGIARLRAFVEENPRHARADNALYLAAVGQAALEEYEAAAETLEGLLHRYPAGDAVVEGILKLAELRMRLNQPRSARALYSKLIANYPGTPAADTAEQRLAALPAN